MAKRRRSGLGAVVARRRGLMGLGALNDPRSIGGILIPTSTGVLVPAAVTLGIRYALPATEGWQQMLHQYAPVAGLGVGLLNAFLMNNLGGRTAGMISGISTALTSFTWFATEWLAGNSGLSGISALGAIVPEYSNPLGYLSMQPADQRGLGGGTELNLGAVNPNAFGAPSYAT